MISLELARRLSRAGHSWDPRSGDRFVVPDRELDHVVFVVSDMVVEVHELPVGRLLAFNGTTEWALDSIMQRDVIWLPREDQLRAMLGNRFRALQTTPDGYVVVVVDPEGQEQRYVDVDAECAYARAVLAVT